MLNLPGTRCFIIPLFLLAFLLQCTLSMVQLSATSDEVAHLPAGYTYLQTGDFRLNPEHPPLIKMLAAYPLLFLNLPSPYTSKYFLKNEKWEYGKSLLYQSGVRAETMLFLGRLVIVLLGLFLAILLFRWTDQLFGERASVFSLFIFVFEPNIIAHSQLVTTDLGFTLFFLLSIYWMWRYFQEPGIKSLIICGLSAGLAFATKFSAILLIPIIFILLLLEIFLSCSSSHRTDTRYLPFHKLLLFAFVVPLIATAVVAASYSFINIKYYFIGLNSVFIHGKMGHAAFLAGQYSDTGWWYYFPLSFLIKTPIPLLIFLFLSALIIFIDILTASSTFKRGRAGVNEAGSSEKDTGKNEQAAVLSIRSWFYLLVPPLLFLTASMMGRLNIGVRHILPVFPFAIILCGIIFSKSWHYRSILLKRPRWKKIVSSIFVLFCAWYVVGSLYIFPRHLSYFNELIGGPSRGYEYSVDSNLDWGQDLPALRKYLDKNHIDGVILSYFGNADPYYYGIDYQYLPLCGKPKIPSNYMDPGRNFDYIAISATHLQSVFTPNHHCFDWLKKRKPYARIAYSIFLFDVRNDPEAHIALAEIYLGSGMPEVARRHFLKAQSIAQQSMHEK
ncbi:MAG: glycosyltransferase family 39 protein [Acidobacteriota bacterium]